MPVTTALIGCGGRGVSALAAWAKQSPKFELVAVCDVDAARVASASAQLGVAAESDYRKLLARSDLDSVIIATNARWHAPIALDAIAAGKHLFVEKPLADTPAASRQLAEAAQAAGVVGIVGYQNRFTPFATALAAELPTVDPVQGLLTLQRQPLMPQYFFADHYGGIVDSATHTLDMALWTMGGTPEGVSAHVRRGTIQGDATIEYMSLIIDFDRGQRSATVVASMLGARPVNVLEFVGPGGTVWSTDQRNLSVALHPRITQPGAGPITGLEHRTVQCEAGSDPTGLVLDHFADRVTGTPLSAAWPRGCTFGEAANAVAISAAMALSAEQGRRVPLSEVR